eukprot:jgi/Ulvmu1/1918/UM012_0078.1
MAADSRKHQTGRGGARKGAGRAGVSNAAVSKNGKGGGAKRTSALRPSIASKIRGVERFLARPNLPDEIRTAQEAKLQQLLQQKASRTMTAAEKKISNRYKMVRFAEKVKLQRRLRSAQRGLDEALAAEPQDPQAVAELQGKVGKLQADLDYVTNFPPGEKYVSLLVDPEGAEDRVRVERERARLHGLVHDHMAARATASAERQAKHRKSGGAVVVAPSDGGIVDMDPDDIGMIVFDDVGARSGAVGAAAAANDRQGKSPAEGPGAADGDSRAVKAGRGGAESAEDASTGQALRAAQQQPASSDSSSGSDGDTEAPVHPDDVQAFAAAPTGRRAADGAPAQQPRSATPRRDARLAPPESDSDSDGGGETPQQAAAARAAVAAVVAPGSGDDGSGSDSGSGSGGAGGGEEEGGDEFFADGDGDDDGAGGRAARSADGARNGVPKALASGGGSDGKKSRQPHGQSAGKEQNGGKWGCTASVSGRRGGAPERLSAKGRSDAGRMPAGVRTKEGRSQSAGGFKQAKPKSVDHKKRAMGGGAADRGAATAAGATGKRRGDGSPVDDTAPKRTRAEGGRKRRKKK